MPKVADMPSTIHVVRRPQHRRWHLEGQQKDSRKHFIGDVFDHLVWLLLLADSSFMSEKNVCLSLL